MEVGHNWGTNTGGRGNLEPVCVPDETCEPECCSSRSNYHPANGVQCALSETGVWIRLCTTLALIFPSWNLLEVSHFLGTGVFTCTLNWLFAFFFKKSVSGECDAQRAVCVRWVGRQTNSFSELIFCSEYWWLASTLLQMTFPTFCVHG